MNKENERILFSTTEVARILGISRIAVHKKVVSGQIPAYKVGRNYVINLQDLQRAQGVEISPKKLESIEAAVKKAVDEYRPTFDRLAKE